MRAVFAVLMIACSGCSLHSRYAMDDPVYADKYADGAEQGDLLGKAKQALDARHTTGLGGLYFSGGAQVKPDSGHTLYGGELGGEAYLSEWSTGRAALAGYVGPDDVYGGLDIGARLQTPTRIAPFVGIGAFNGFSTGEERADDDGIDNDDDGLVDERREKRTTYDGWLSAIYPEVGLHLWLDGCWRVTAYGRYLVTTEGRGQDDWLLGLQIAGFSR